jgi:hypothetical protein
VRDIAIEDIMHRFAAGDPVLLDTTTTTTGGD